MRWKRVVWAGWLAPAVTGCHTPGAAVTPDLPSGGLVAHTQAAIEHRIRADAREAWRAVRAEYPRRCFTAEFHDGFLDGYSDHLDRGGDGTPPATPPLRYTRHARYFTPEGHVLLKDYFLGFRYGAEVAAATGRRQFLTVPVLVPDGGPTEVVEPVAAAPTSDAPVPRPAPAAVPQPPPVPTPQPLPPPPQTAAPPAPQPSRPPVTVPPAPVPPAAPAGNRVGFHLPSWNRDRSAPAQTAPARPARPTEPDLSKFGSPAAQPALPAADTPAGVPAPAVPVALPVVRIPEPPPAVPTLPPSVPTPPAAGDLPVVPPNFDLLPPLPPNHPEPNR
jgi:hypothetical protein